MKQKTLTTLLAFATLSTVVHASPSEWDCQSPFNFGPTQGDCWWQRSWSLGDGPICPDDGFGFNQDWIGQLSNIGPLNFGSCQFGSEQDCEIDWPDWNCVWVCEWKCDWDWDCSKDWDCKPPLVPAPATIAMVAFGTGLVGWIRHKRLI
jgi:hypothetical protein